MYWYTIGRTLYPAEGEPAEDGPAVAVLTSEELSRQPALSGLGEVLCHTPPARDARVCKAEVRSASARWSTAWAGFYTPFLSS